MLTFVSKVWKRKRNVRVLKAKGQLDHCALWLDSPNEQNSPSSECMQICVMLTLYNLWLKNSNLYIFSSKTLKAGFRVTIFVEGWVYHPQNYKIKQINKLKMNKQLTHPQLLFGFSPQFWWPTHQQSITNHLTFKSLSILNCCLLGMKLFVSTNRRELYNHFSKTPGRKSLKNMAGKWTLEMRKRAERSWEVWQGPGCVHEACPAGRRLNLPGRWGCHRPIWTNKLLDKGVKRDARAVITLSRYSG